MGVSCGQFQSSITSPGHKTYKYRNSVITYRDLLLQGVFWWTHLSSSASFYKLYRSTAGKPHREPGQRVSSFIGHSCHSQEASSVSTSQPSTINHMLKCMCEKGWLRNLLEKTGWGNSRSTEKGNICWWWMEDKDEEIIDKWALATEGTFTLPTMNSLHWHTHTWEVKHHSKVGQIRPSSWGQIPLIPLLLDSLSFPCPIAPIDNLFPCCVHCQITASSWRFWDGKPYLCMNV